MYHVISFSSIGNFGLVEKNGVLVGLDFLNNNQFSPSPENAPKARCILELGEYFAGKRREFSIPISLHGTSFQQAVWKEISSIPFGCTLFYSQIAEKTGSPRSYRAVGTAVGKNPIPIIIPCHRVVARNGLGGFRGGLPLKKLFLTLEGIRY